MPSNISHDINDIFNKLSNTYEIVETFCMHEGSCYVSLRNYLLLNLNSPREVQFLINRRPPSEIFTEIFGRTRAPAFLLAAPALLLYAATHLSNNNNNINNNNNNDDNNNNNNNNDNNNNNNDNNNNNNDDNNNNNNNDNNNNNNNESGWGDVSIFLQATHTALLASPQQNVAKITKLPPLPILGRQQKQNNNNNNNNNNTPSWENILTEKVLADLAELPPTLSYEKENENAIGAANFGVILCVLACGLSHLLYTFLTITTTVEKEKGKTLHDPTQLARGAGTLEFCKDILQLSLTPTVILYGAKEINIQIAFASLLLSLRAVLAARESAGETQQKEFMQQWSKAMQCWFDLATQSGNTICMRVLFPYMISTDMYWEL